MELESEKPSSLPSNYVTIHQLKERWLQQQQQSSSKPKPENPKTKPNTQNQRPNFGRVTKEHKPKEVKVDDNGSTSKTLVVNEMKNPNKNDATKHCQRPNYRPVINQPKPKVDDNGSTSKALVSDDLKNLNIQPNGNEATKPKVDDGGSSSKTLVGVIDNKLNGENESGTKKKRKKKYKKLRNPKVVTDQNPTGAEEEPGAKVVEEDLEKRSYLSGKDPEVEMVEGKGKERRRYGRGNGKGDLRFGAEPKRKVELEQEAEVVKEKMEKSCPTDKTPEVEMVEGKGKEGGRYGRGNGKGNSRFGAEPVREMEPVHGAEVVEEEMVKKSYPTDNTTEVEMVEGKGKEWRRYGRRNGNSRFGAEPERKMELKQEVEVVEEKMEKKSYGCRKPADKNLNGAELKPEMEEEEEVVEKGKWGHRYGRRNGNSRVVWEQKEKKEPVDGNGGGGGDDDDGVVEEVVKERNVGQGRDINGGYGNGNLRFGAEPELKMQPEQEAEVVEEKNEKKSYGRRKPADKNPNGAELQPEMEEEVVVEKGRWGCRYGRRNGNSRVVWEQKEKIAPVDGNGGGGGGGVVEEVVKEMNVGQGSDKNGDYGRDKNEDYGRDRKCWDLRTC